MGKLDSYFAVKPNLLWKLKLEFCRFNHEIHQFPLFMQHPYNCQAAGPQNQEIEEKIGQKLRNYGPVSFGLVEQTKNRGFRLFGGLLRK